MKKIIQAYHPGTQEPAAKKISRKKIKKMIYWFDETKTNGIMFRNMFDHVRKTMTTNGKFITTYPETLVNEGNILFWGEWEYDSLIEDNYTVYRKDGAEYIHKPIFIPTVETALNAGTCRSTDPFVFENTFSFSHCIQSFNEIRDLSEGSIILFGSRTNINDDGNFEYGIDTVFVVKETINLPLNQEQYDKLSDIYKATNIDLINPFHYTHNTLYIGATYENQTNNGMFSFAPCKLDNQENRRIFKRLSFNLADVINFKLAKLGKNTGIKKIGYGNNNFIFKHTDMDSKNVIHEKQTNNSANVEIKNYWEQLVEKTLNDGFYLGIEIDKPTIITSANMHKFGLNNFILQQRNEFLYNNGNIETQPSL